MNKSKVIHLAAYSLAFLLIAFVVFRLFALGADLGLQQAELRETSSKLGNLLNIDIKQISSVQIKNSFTDVFLLNVQEKIEDWEKKEYKLHLNKEITQALDDITVTSHGIKWQLFEPNLVKVDQRQIEKVINTVAKLPFYSVSVANNEEQLAKCGLLHPQLIVKCVFSNRQETEMHVGIASKDDPNRYYLRFKNSTVVFEVGSEIRNLFATKYAFAEQEIGAKQFVSNPNYFSFVRASDSFYLDAYRNDPTEIWHEHSLHSKQTDNNLRWYSYRPFYNLLNQTVFREISQIFTNLRAADCLDELSDRPTTYVNQLEQYGFDEPSFRLRMGEVRGLMWELVVGKKVGDFYYVKTSNLPYVYLVEQRFFNSLLLPNYQYMRSKPFAFSLKSLARFEYKDNERIVQLNLSEQESGASKQAYGYSLQSLVNYAEVAHMSVAPNLPFNSKQHILAEYQKRIYASELSKENLLLNWPENYNIMLQSVRSKEGKLIVADRQKFQLASSSAISEKCQALFNEFFGVLGAVRASDLTWQTSFLDKNSTANYEFKFIFQNGQILHFTLYEANLNSYYLYINGSFSYYVIHKDLLLGSSKVNYLADLSNKIAKLLQSTK